MSASLVGDGVTGNSDALVAAVSALGPAGGVIELNPGEYVLEKPTTLSNPHNVTLRGQGEVIVRSALPSGGSALTVGTSGPTFGFGIDGLVFKGGGAEDAVLTVNYTLDARLRGVTVRDAANDGLVLQRPQNVVLRDSEFRNIVGTSVTVQAFAGNNGQTCRIIDSTVKDNGTGIALLGGGEHIIRGCGVESNATGIVLTSLRHVVQGNIFELNTTPIQWGTAELLSRDSLVSYNQIVGGEMAFVHYGREKFKDNSLSDHHTGSQWSASFAASPTYNTTAHVTRWVENVETPDGAGNGRFTDLAAEGVIVFT